MKTYGLFDLIGPQMIGPSSSHTAGAARIGFIAYRMAEGDLKKAKVTLYGSFAQTGRGHGTDKAIAAGILGLAPDDERLKDSFALAESQGVEIEIAFSPDEVRHPNTARIEAECRSGRTFSLVGISVGGGNIEICEINGMEVSFSCDYPTLLIFYQDRPGVIRYVTGLLADKKINVATMVCFRQSKHKGACMVIETDTEVPAVLTELMKTVNEELEEVIRI